MHKGLFVLQDWPKNPSVFLFWERRGGKPKTIRKTKPTTTILLLKRLTEYANRKKSHPIPPKPLKIQSQKYMGSPLRLPVSCYKPKKALKIIDVNNDEVSNRFFPTWIISKSTTSGQLSTRRRAKEDNARQAQGSILFGTGTSATAPQGAEQTQQQSACSKEAGPW